MFVFALVMLPLYIVCPLPYTESTTSSCLWHIDSCVDKCPDNLVITESNCNQSYWLAQRTCKDPEITLVGTVCGFSRCDCPGTTVMDTETGFCYEVDNCPMKHEIIISRPMML
nr:uncharacterized protein LOC116772697 isoform X2 [Danaus plexippus plexippus]